jgi:peptidoglycan/xylan/chitin deacetylase (PgdA/CDA1 family)
MTLISEGAATDPMPARRLKYIGILFLGVVVAALVYIFVVTFYISKDYLYGLPLVFTQNRYLFADVYPRGCESATVFTNNYIEGKSQVDDIAILRHFLKKKKVRGVFFVIPDYLRTYPLDRSPEVAEELKELAADGHEIAQCGTYHTYGDDIARGAPTGGELLELSYDEQKDRIGEGQALLSRLGFSPAGFRAPEFMINRETYRVLETCDYLYSANALAPPTTPYTLFFPSLSRGVLYPDHPNGFDLLEYTDQVDPTFKFSKAVRLFQRIHSLHGVFVYHTYIGEVARPERLQLLEKFLDAVQKENTWQCTLSELSRWWLARERMRVETRKDGEVFQVTITNKTAYPLEELGLRFLKFPFGIKEYVVRDRDGRVITRGSLPVKDKISVTIPGAGAP